MFWYQLFLKNVKGSWVSKSKTSIFCEPYIYCKFLTCGSMAHQSKFACKATVLQLAGLKLMTYRSKPDALTNHDKLLSNKWLKCKKYKVVYFQSREKERVHHKMEGVPYLLPRKHVAKYIFITLTFDQS